MMQAAGYPKHTEVVELLLQAGCNIDLQDAVWVVEACGFGNIIIDLETLATFVHSSELATITNTHT